MAGITCTFVDLQHLIASVVAVQGRIFGEAFDLGVVGLSDLAPDTAIPGVAVFSRRSIPLAAWTRCASVRKSVFKY